MTLAEIKDLATICGFVVGAVSLVFVAYNTVLTLRTNRARFWLDLRSAFSKPDEVHQKLRPEGEWSGNYQPQGAEEKSKIEAYMGLFEHCESMLNEKLIDEKTFRDIYKYRLENLVANSWVKNEKIRARAAGWRRFIALLDRMKVEFRN